MFQITQQIILGRRYDAYNYNAINTFNATRHLSGVRMYSPHAPLKWRLERPQKSNLNPEIVAVRDGLYCRVNVTVRLAFTAYSLAGHLS